MPKNAKLFLINFFILRLIGDGGLIYKSVTSSWVCESLRAWWLVVAKLLLDLRAQTCICLV